MSAFAGVVALDGATIDREIEASASLAMTASHPGRTLVRRAAGAAFVQRDASTGAQLHGETHPLMVGDGATLFVALARLDNREELGASLGLGGAELARRSDAHLLLAMHERWGDDGVARCVGAFAFALWDAEARRLTLGRDCLGNRPLFYHRGAHFVAFATSLRSLLALPGVPRALDELALAQFIAVNHRERERTLYRGIDRVPGRTMVSIDRNGVRSRKYWAPDFDAAPIYRREEDYIERARELLDLAVASAIRDTPHVAVATSGGLDSSAIAATAARLGTAESITCFSRVPPPGTQIDVGPFRYLDERDKVEVKAQFFLTSTPSPRRNKLRFLRLRQRPGENVVVVIFAQCTRDRRSPKMLQGHRTANAKNRTSHQQCLALASGSYRRYSLVPAAYSCTV
jgi:asparagine synthase (glutamine-hydrolysing)